MVSRDSPAPAVDPDRLQGWKDIAAHLGKAVRTVQRWEKEYGLPVHRLGREGEIRWASRAELDQWMRASSARLKDSTGAEEAGIDRKHFVSIATDDLFGLGLLDRTTSTYPGGAESYINCARNAPCDLSLAPAGAVLEEQGGRDASFKIIR